MQRAILVTLFLGACNLDSRLQTPDGPPPDTEPDAEPSCSTCQLLALRPAIAESGDTLTLEGTFVDPTTVIFPGGPTATATVLGPNRATVVVPATAGAGDLVVTSGGTELRPVTFRRATYALELQTFARYDNADAPRQNPVLSTPRQLATSATVGKFVYVFGGFNTSPIATIERAPVNADGSLGRFVNANVMLTLPRAGATATVIGDHVYVVGGFTTGIVFQSSIERAPVAADGSIGTFEVVSSALTRVRGQHVAALIGNFLYVFAGNDSASNTALASIERAPIASDGTLGEFTEVGALVGKRLNAALAISDNTVYVCGGLDSGGLATVERATINTDGTLSAFTTAGTMNVTHIGPEAVVVNGKLFVIGGQTDAIESATIAANGSLSAFTTTTSKLAPSRFSSTSVVVEGNFYALGGAISGSSSVVDRASLNASSDFGAPAASNPLVIARRKQASIVIGDFLYVVGGADNGGVALTSIERAAIAPDGTLGAFSVVSSQLGIGRKGHSLVVVGDKLFVIGGQANGGVSQSSIEKATITSDGSLGAFTTHGTALLATRSFHTSVVIGNLVHVIGGVGGAGGKTLERASIATGDLGSFEAVTNQMQQLRSAPVAIVSLNTLYVLGGHDGVTARTDIEQATIASDGSIGTFSTAPAIFQTGRTNSAAAVIGRFLYVIGGHSPGVTTSIERAPISVDGTLGTFSSFSRALPNARAQHSVAVVRDQLHIIGGGSGGLNVEGSNTAATNSATLE